MAATFSLLLSVLLALVVASVRCIRLPDAYSETPEIIKHWGYPVETHEALTEDGYYLTLHRIPHGRNTTVTPPDGLNKTRPAFLLVHSLMASSASFVFNLPKQSLGFVLADAGYDVWLGNVRGNTYSKKHKYLNVKSKQFWDFSFHEMAMYDLPAMVDHVLNSTSQKALYYVGHSQGTMMSFVGLSGNTALQKKIKVNFALGPVSRMRHLSTSFKAMAAVETRIHFILNLFGIREVFAGSAFIKTFDRILCRFLPSVCLIFTQLLNGFDSKNMNKTRTQVFLSHIPAGTSLKNMDHFMQNIRSGLFAKYDYGVWGNLQHYKSTKPPQYDITEVRVPTVLFSGGHDTVAAPEDVEWTKSQLWRTSTVQHFVIPSYNHMDWICGMDAAKVHNRIIHITRKYQAEN